MKIFFLSSVIFSHAILQAQNAITSNFVEGGKTLIELIRVLKPAKTLYIPTTDINPDSCASKKQADVSFKNRTNKMILVSLYLRTGNLYDAEPLSLKLAPASQESLYEVKSGIYKYRIETDSSGQRAVLHEGELKLLPCDKLIKEIKSY